MAARARAIAHSKSSTKPSTKPRSDNHLNIRVAAETKAQIERAAQAARQTLTEFTRAAVVARAEEVLARQERIVLSDRDYELFTQIMTADAEPTETALREAAEFRTGRMTGSKYHW